MTETPDYEPVTDEQLAQLIACKEQWLTDAKAPDATWPKDLRRGIEHVQRGLAALLELQERRCAKETD